MLKLSLPVLGGVASQIVPTNTEPLDEGTKTLAQRIIVDVDPKERNQNYQLKDDSATCS